VCKTERLLLNLSTAMLVIAQLSVAEARGIHYGAVTDPQVLKCDQQHWRGQIESAENCYAGVLNSDAGAAVRAEAAWALGDLELANRLFQRALSLAPNDAAAKVRWGDLFATSHQNAEAMNIYREVLAQESGNAFALLGAARVLVDRFEDAANTYLQPLIEGETNADGALIGAWLLVAQVALENGHYNEAQGALDQAQETIEKNHWPLLEVYALRVAAALLDDVDGSNWTELSLAYNAHYGGIYATPAHFYVITRRYRDAIDLYQKAVDIEPGLAAAHEELGINLLRDNQMTRARKHLEIAYAEDPFSPKAVNSLRLMDSYSDFRLIDDRPDVPGVVPVTLRLHEDEATAIAPYAIKLTRDSIAVFTERYGFALREPVIIEMYPDHEDFAVRTAGMPGLGILGATFGYVIAMDSPSGRSTQQFQWGTTLWHEMAHVFTLEASDHLVPRWYSEGVSVFEEWRSGPNPGVRIPMAVYNAMQDGRFLPIANLDEGFLRPTYEEQVIVSYMQAGLVCDFIDRYYGEDALRNVLYAFRDGLKTVAAIESVLQTTTSDFDRAFATFVDDEHGAVLEQLQNWQQTQTSIGNKLAAEEWVEAAELAKQLIAIIPQYIEHDSPYLALARARHELGEQAQALASLETFWRNGGYEPASLQRLSQWLIAADKSSTAIEVLQSINLVDPLDGDLHGKLGDMLLESGQADDALREFEIALALKPHDMATAWYRLAQAQHELGNIETSQGYLLQALDVAPNFRPAQRLLLRLTNPPID